MRRFIALFILAVLLPLAAHSQGITYNQTITWAGQVGISTPAPSDIIRDVNQTSAWLTACINDGGNTATAELEGSYDKVNWSQISAVATIGNTGITGNSCTGMTAGGYWPFTRLNVLTLSGSVGTPTVFASYSASFTPISSQGIARLGSQPQPIVQLPSRNTYLNSALSDTPQEIDAAGGDAVTSISVVNPNAATVYVFVMTASDSVPPVANNFGYWLPVAANSTVNVAYTVPIAVINTGAGTYVACSTSATALAAPGTACQLSMAFQPLPSVNTRVNAAGTILNSSVDNTPSAINKAGGGGLD